MEQEPPHATGPSLSYEPPQVERVIDREDLEREVLYAAGAPTLS